MCNPSFNPARSSKGPVIIYGGGGGGTKRECGGGGQVKVYPYKKKGGGDNFSHAEGGEGAKRLEVDFTLELEVLAILKRVAKVFPPFKKKGGGATSFTPPPN